MEATISYPNATALRISGSAPKIGGFRPNVSVSRWRKREGRLKVEKCAKRDSVVWEGEDELKMEEELKKKSSRCRGMGGIVELMECLEREAIMGEDEGREASDYNRRALIFDWSSRVFQALKHQSLTQTQT